MQVSLQCVLATDGNASFAIYYYDDFDRLLQSVHEEAAVIGFGKGDGKSFLAIPLQSSSQTNIYRIDGMYILLYEIGNTYRNNQARRVVGILMCLIFLVLTVGSRPVR